jgi:hypothetical protein
MRDDFSLDIKDLLAKRVGMRCSNPNCRRVTSGPQEDPRKSINIGVAAHITAAAPKGPRFDKNLTAEERRSPDNGIWLCPAGHVVLACACLMLATLFMMLTQT